METLISFLKSSTVVDLLILLFILFVTVVMIPVGITIVVASRSRMPAYIFLLSASLPLLLALIGTWMRFVSIEEAVRQNPEVGEQVIVAARQEAWITTYIGAAGTTMLALIGVTAVVKKEREA
ncbi:MAG TPA: hypothetical protein VNO50_18530 [Pyrinomonadaceae bacterium]|nr:hypothetical protein [Pyrinomonadaceae bacterium]